MSQSKIMVFINRVNAGNFNLNLEYPKIHPKYAFHVFSVTANLDWKITKIIFRVNFGIFEILKNPRIQPEKYRNSP